MDSFPDLQVELDRKRALSLHKLVKYLKVFHPHAAMSYPALSRLVDQGKIIAIKYGGVAKVSKEEIERFVREGNREVAPQGAPPQPSAVLETDGVTQIEAPPSPEDVQDLSIKDLINVGRRYRDKELD